MQILKCIALLVATVASVAVVQPLYIEQRINKLEAEIKALQPVGFVAELQAELNALANTAGPHSDAIQNILDRVPGRKGIQQIQVPQLVLPCGNWVLDKPVHLTKPVRLDLNGSDILIPDDGDGFYLDGMWSILENGTIRTADFRRAPADRVATGWAVTVRKNGCKVQDIIFLGCGNGLRYGDPERNAAGMPAWNSNTCRFRDLVFFMTRDTPIWVRGGGETNASLFSGCSISGGRIGVRNESFLGNVYTAMHMEALAEHGIYTGDRNPYDTFLGCYTENDVGSRTKDARKRQDLSQLTTTVGGNLVLWAYEGDRVGLGKSKIRFEETAPDGTVFSSVIPFAQDYSWQTYSYIRNGKNMSAEYNLRMTPQDEGMRLFKRSNSQSTPVVNQ